MEQIIKLKKNTPKLVNFREKISEIFLIHERFKYYKKNRLKIITEKFRGALYEQISPLL